MTQGKLSNEQAKERLISVGYLPLEPYPGDLDTPWAIKCNGCGKERKRALRRWKTFGCQTCAGQKNRMAPSEVDLILSDGPLQRVGEYSSSYAVQVRCKVCVEEFFANVSSFKSQGYSSCRYCAGWAIRPSELARRIVMVTWAKLLSSPPETVSQECTWLCNTCGEESEKTLYEAEVSGCKKCQPIAISQAKAPLPTTAEAAAFEKGFFALEPFPGAGMLPWKLECIHCSKPDHYYFNNLRQWRCSFCHLDRSKQRKIEKKRIKDAQHYHLIQQLSNRFRVKPPNSSKGKLTTDTEEVRAAIRDFLVRIPVSERDKFRLHVEFPELLMCGRCNQNKWFDDFRWKSGKKVKWHTKSSYCRQCELNAYGEYRTKYPDRVRETKKKWSDSNPEVVRKMRQRYQQKHKNEIRKRWLAWAKDKKEYLRDYNRQYALLNKEKKALADRLYREENRERTNDISRRRRARKRQANVYRIEPEELENLVSRSCIYCGDRAEHIDHVIPLARGGNHGIGNLAPACAWCNLSKGAKFVSVWRFNEGVLGQYGKSCRSLRHS